MKKAINIQGSLIIWAILTVGGLPFWGICYAILGLCYLLFTNEE